MEKNTEFQRNNFIFNLIPCIIFILDKNKNIVQVNKKIEEINYKIEEIKGKNIYDLPIFINKERLKEVFEKKGETFKLDILTMENKKKIGLCEVEKINEEYIFIIKDITEEEFLRMKLEQEYELLNAWEEFFEKAIAGIYIYDEDFNFLYVNPAFCNIFGLSREEIMKKKAYEIVYKDDIPLVIEMAKKRFSGEIESAEFYVRGVDKYGKIKYGKVIGKIAKYKGKKVIMGTVIDVTDRVEYENKLKENQNLIEITLNGTIYAISKIVEVKDPYTAGHQLKVSKLAEAIAKEIGYKENEIKEIVWASLLHDIGKIGIPSEILVMPRKLNSIEFNIIKTHPITGYNIIKVIPNFEKLAEIVLQHHERLDGTGYPKGLKGDEILKEARIIGVSDVIEAMTAYRPYRPALPLDEGLNEIYKDKGIKYDEEIVEICIDLFKKKNFSFD
ncbi:MAG: PAS domain S-box protein [Candidatus Omnitrophica bacterium]|nr:PAS domain S-box protein [Candidatus Omnitrophota bacterium]